MCSFYTDILYMCVHCTEDSKHIFPKIKLLGLVPNFHIHVSGSDLYIPIIVLNWDLFFLFCGR
jgi:hypothetical protein